MARSFEEEIAELNATMAERAARGLAFEYQHPGVDTPAGLDWDPAAPAASVQGSIILDIVTGAAEKKLTLALLTGQGLLHARPLASVDELGWFPAVMPEGAVLVVNVSQLQGVVIPPGAALG